MSNANLSIRIALVNDIPKMQELICLSARKLSVKHYSEAQIQAAIDDVFGVDSDLVEDQTYFIVEQNGAMAACGGWSKRKTLYGGDQYGERDSGFLNPSTDRAKIRAFFVHPDFAGQGVGELLLLHCENEASKHGFTSTELMSTMPAVKFYSRHGYKEEKSTVNITRDGTEIPFVQMCKRLSHDKPQEAVLGTALS